MEGQKIESLFTDDGEFANNMEPPLHDVESMEISRIARVCWIAEVDDAATDDLNRVSGKVNKFFKILSSNLHELFCGRLLKLLYKMCWKT